MEANMPATTAAYFSQPGRSNNRRNTENHDLFAPKLSKFSHFRSFDNYNNNAAQGLILCN